MQQDFGDLEIPRDNIGQGSKIGDGSFGTVYSGTYKRLEINNGEVLPVAIKEAKDERTREQLLSEADRMM